MLYIVHFIYVENDYRWCVSMCVILVHIDWVHWAELNGAAYQHLLNAFKSMHNNKFQIDIG